MNAWGKVRVGQGNLLSIDLDVMQRVQLVIPIE